jgi:hypothetical protein
MSGDNFIKIFGPMKNKTYFIRRWQIELKDKFYINNIEINSLLFASDQVILTNSEGNL